MTSPQTDIVIIGLHWRPDKRKYRKIDVKASFRGRCKHNTVNRMRNTNPLKPLRPKHAVIGTHPLLKTVKAEGVVG